MIGYILLAILALSVISYAIGRRRAVASVEGRQSELHSRPNYHGAFVAAWVGIPAFLLVLVWLALQGPVIDRLLLWSLPIGTTDGMDTGQISLLLSEIKSVAAGNIFGEPSLLVQEAAERYQRWQTIARYAMIAAVFSVALLGLAVAAGRISPEFRARHAEHVIDVGMGEPDRHGARAGLLHFVQDQPGFLPGVDDHALAGGCIDHEVAVLGEDAVRNLDNPRSWRVSHCDAP